MSNARHPVRQPADPHEPDDSWVVLAPRQATPLLEHSPTLARLGPPTHAQPARPNPCKLRARRRVAGTRQAWRLLRHGSDQNRAAKPPTCTITARCAGSTVSQRPSVPCCRRLMQRRHGWWPALEWQRQHCVRLISKIVAGVQCPVGPNTFALRCRSQSGAHAVMGAVPKQERSDMARRPKIPSIPKTPELAASEQPSIADEASVRLRRGPKPKAPASTKPLKFAQRSVQAEKAARAKAPAVEVPRIEASVRDAGATPARKATIGRPKRASDAAAEAPVRQSAGPAKSEQPTKRRRGRKAHKMKSSATPDMVIGAVPQSPAEAMPSADPAQPAGMEAASEAAYPKAAHWDQATGAVRFDWAEIEQTASKPGPNQVMAKLLIAARAEGANSRWPL